MNPDGVEFVTMMSTDDEFDGTFHDFCLAYAEGSRNPEWLAKLNKALTAQGYGLRECDPKHDPYAPCARCSHPYEKHFDPYEGDREVGCKWCHHECPTFVEPEPQP